MSRSRARPALGVGLIWLFLALFLVYPLLRIFYDAVTDEGGRLTLANFAAFFTDAFYLRALWKSLVLGVATVAASSVIGIAVAFVLVETLHLFPMITLNVVDALGKIDPSLEESAESVGARGWRKFWTVTLPLMTPGYVAGALLVFIWTFSDFATPLILGVQDLLAPQAYLNIVQFVDRRIFRMGIVISALMVMLA